MGKLTLVVPGQDCPLWSSSAPLASVISIGESHAPALLEETSVLFMDVRSLGRGGGRPLPGFSGDWFVLLAGRDAWVPEALPDFVLASSRMIALERLGRPLIGSARLAVYRRMGSALQAPELPVLFGPGADPGSGWVSLWDKTVFERPDFGVPVWRDDPRVLESVFDAIRGDSSIWIQPGFAFSLPSAPSSFQSISGDMCEGVLCVSSQQPGGWVVATATDLSRVLGLPEPCSFSELDSKLGSVFIRNFANWLLSFLSAA